MYYTPKKFVELTPKQKNMFNLIKNNLIWLERPYVLKGDNDIKISFYNYDYNNKPLTSARVFSETFDEMFELGFIHCVKLNEDFYSIENAVVYEND